jgi:hypothetical protein
MINLPHPSPINGNRGNVCMLKMGESNDEADASVGVKPILDLEREVSAAREKVAVSNQKLLRVSLSNQGVLCD